jgi:hypothetical protein
MSKDPDAYWAAVECSPIFSIAKESWQRTGSEVHVTRGELRAFFTSYHEKVTATLFEDGLELVLSIPRQSLWNANHTSALERIGAFLLSHPHQEPSHWAIVCAVGGLTSEELRPWPERDRSGASDSEDVEWVVQNATNDVNLPLQRALDVIRGRAGYFYSDELRLLNTSTGMLEVHVDDRPRFHWGTSFPVHIPFPWGVELLYAGRVPAAGTLQQTRARQAVAGHCIGRLELSEVEAALNKLQTSDDQLERWIEAVLTNCSEARELALGPALMRHRLATLLECGSGVAWPVTFYERTRALPFPTAHLALVELPDRRPAEPGVKAAAAIARSLIGELTSEALAQELSGLTIGEGRHPAGAALRCARGYEQGLLTDDELQHSLWGALVDTIWTIEESARRTS